MSKKTSRFETGSSDGKTEMELPKWQFYTIGYPPMDANWFYESKGERQGPLTEEALSKLKETGVISDTNLVWTEGMADWISYGESPLNLSNSGTPPPVPQERSVVVQPSAPGTPTPKEPFVARTARLREDSSVQIRYTLGRAWKLLRSDFWPLLGYCTLLAVIVNIAMQIGITVFFLLFPMMAGGYYYLLKRTRNQSGTVDDLFDGFRRRFGDLAIVNLVVIIPLLVGMFLPIALTGLLGILISEKIGDDQEILLFIIMPIAIIFCVFLTGLISMYGALATMLVIDCDIKGKDAMGLAWTATKKHWFKLSLFGITSIVLSFAGIIAIYVGAFVTNAWTMIATAYLYEDIFGDIPQKKISKH